MAIRLAAAFLVGIVLETLLYGIFIMIFCLSVYLRWEKSRQPQTTVMLNKTMFFASIFFFFIVSAHWGLNFARLFNATLNTRGGVLIDLYFANLRDPMSITKTVCFEVQIWFGDMIIMYRLWHVYNRRTSVIVFPCLIWVSLWVTGSALIWEMAHADAGGVFQHKINQWITACFTLTLVNNLYCTGLISLRLWNSHRAIKPLGNFGIIRVLVIFGESAVLWTLFVSLTFITFLAKSNVQYSFIDMTSPAVGISFCLIIARLDWQSREKSTTSNNGTSITSHPTFQLRPTFDAASDKIDDAYISRSRRVDF